MASIGPVVLSTVGDQYIEGARIQSIVWVGATSAGNVAKLICRGTGSLLWEGRTDTTNTYQGASWNKGAHAPYGFRASVLDGGKLLVYLLEG